MDGNLVNTLSAVAGILLSLGFEYIPGLSVWYNGRDSQTKALIMLGLIVLAAAGSFGLSCYSPYEVVACSQDGAWGLVSAVIAAAVANQSTHSLAKRRKLTATVTEPSGTP